MHRSLLSFMSNSLRGCTSPSLIPCGRRGTACGGGWRTRFLIRVPYTLAPILAPLCQLARFACARYVAVSYQLARPTGYHPPLARSPLFQRKRALLRCTGLPISRTQQLSPTADAVPPLSEKEGFPSLHPPANLPDPAAITHRWRGPPSFRERGLSFVVMSCQLAGPAGYHPPLSRSPLFQRKRALLRCTALQINCGVLLLFCCAKK